MNYGTALRNEIRSDGITPLIGIYDMHSASVAAQHYNGLFVSGFGFAASHYGLPDIGFIAWSDIVAFVQRLRLAFPAPTCWSTSTTATSTRRSPATSSSTWSASAPPA
ncbi:hypothetical protein ACFQ0O_01820 [Saccharopolyspora spinosporotrichia]